MIILSECTLGRDQRPILIPHPIELTDYTHTMLFGVCRTVYPSTNCVHHALWIRKLVSQLTTYPYEILAPWTGIEPIT
jgi:hypothetical protein